MRFTEFNINESTRGVLFRAIGDPFVSQNNPSQVATFAGSMLFPPTTPGKGAAKFDSIDDLKETMAEIEAKYPNIIWTNKPNINTLAFALVFLNDTTTRKKIVFGRYFREISPNMAGKWLNDQLPGYKLNIKSSRKSNSGLKPNDLLPLGQQFKNPQAVLQSLNPSIDPSIKAGLDMLLKKKLPTFSVDPEMMPAIRDDLGEIISPLALWQGMIGGQAEQARQFLLKNTPWSACSIIFSASKNAGLVDSLIRPPKGVAIGISSKGDAGAKASASNIYSGIELLRSSNQGAVVDQYPEAVFVLETIKKETALRGPFALGMQYQLCTSEDEALILGAINKGIRQVPTTPKWRNVRVMMSKLNPRDMDKPNYNIGYHALAGLAKMVQDHVNTKVPKFSEACLKFLNSSPLIQIHLNATTTQTGVAVTGFNPIWPPNFTGQLTLNAGKSYYATGVINKFAFGF